MAVQSLKVLRRRLRAVKNTGKITRAMEMVAASKLRRAQGALVAGRPYTARIRRLLAGLAGDPAVAAHPLFQPREAGDKVLVIFTSDRGLCGSFNANVIKLAESLLLAEPGANWQLVCVGRKGRDYFQRRRWLVVESHVGLGGQADAALARRIAEGLTRCFLEGRCAEVRLVYSAFISTVVTRPTAAQFLPLTPEAIGEAATAREGRRAVEYILEPSAGAVLKALLPRLLASRIYTTMAESATAEHSARMISMNNATKNCNEMSDHLTLQLNKARQASITRELLDIVGGAEALKG